MEETKSVSRSDAPQPAPAPAVEPARAPAAAGFRRPTSFGAPRGGRRPGGRFYGRGAPRKPCRMCIDRKDTVDFKDVSFLRNYIMERGKMLPSRISGNCAWHQRVVQGAIKKARVMALLPFTVK